MRGDNINPNRSSYQNNNKLGKIEDFTWKKIESLERSKTVIFIPISPLEEHGPHLPVGTDLFTAVDGAKEAIKRLQTERSDQKFILFPPIPLGYTKMAACFPGTVSIPVKTVTSVVYNVCASLASFGFQNFVICTFHMDLGHLKGIYNAMKKLRKKYSVCIVEPWGPYFFSKEVEKREPEVGFDTKKEIHAGFRETSLMKYQYPYLVDPSYSNLQSIYRDLYSPRCLGKTFKDIGITAGYVGSPARADSDYGRWYFQEYVNSYVQSTLDLVDGKELPDLPKQTKMLMKSLFWL